MLTGAASAAIALNRRLVREVLPWTVPILGGVALFFAFLLVFVASPFATQAAPADGAGLNPSLQNPYMIAHPPLLYLGYVGLTIPFAFAMAALASRRVDERWIVVTRRWTLAAWTFLGFGILLGAKWAYEEVGWGGWYAWDPVENAALMPWLVATAFLHSVMVQEKKNMLRVWNVVLVARRVRALALRHVPHAQRRPQLDPQLHAVVDRAVLPRLHRRRGRLLDRADPLAAPAPALEDAARVARLARGRVPLQQPLPRRARADGPLGRHLPARLRGRSRRGGDRRGAVLRLLRDRLRPAARPPHGHRAGRRLAAGVAPLARLAARRRRPASRSRSGSCSCSRAPGSSPAGLVGYTFAAFVLTTIVLEFVRGTRARKALGAGGWWSAFSGLVARNRRRYGGYVVHAAIVLLLIGAVGIGGFSTHEQGRLAPGESTDGRRLPRRLHRQRASSAARTRRRCARNLDV